MKLRVPKDCIGLSYLGMALEITKEGAVEVEDSAWDRLAAHGFERWSDPGLDKSGLASDPPAVCVAKTESSRVAAPPGIPVRLRPDDCGGLSNRPTAPSADGLTTPDPVTTLNRQALFAYLKRRGVAVSLPVTNEELRTLARRALNGALGAPDATGGKLA
jgi:hypothetical protein